MAGRIGLEGCDEPFSLALAGRFDDELPALGEPHDDVLPELLKREDVLDVALLVALLAITELDHEVVFVRLDLRVPEEAHARPGVDGVQEPEPSGAEEHCRTEAANEPNGRRQSTQHSQNERQAERDAHAETAPPIAEPAANRYGERLSHR